MNPEVSGKLSVFNFLSILEKQMKRTNDRIRAGCQRETRAVEATKNRLLAAELEKLLTRREGVLNFLENCGSIVALKSVAEAKGFVAQTIPGVEDIGWMSSHEGTLISVAQALHRRLCPESRVDEEILNNVTSWAFQDPPPPETRVGVSQTRLSLVDNGPRKSYVALRERLEREYSCPGNETGQNVVSQEEMELDVEGRATRVVVRVCKKEGEDVRWV